MQPTHSSCPRPRPKEPPKAQSRAVHNRRKAAAHDSSAEKDIKHLHPVSSSTSVHETICVVCAWELLAFWDRYVQELAERFPAFAHLVLQKVLCRHQ